MRKEAGTIEVLTGTRVLSEMITTLIGDPDPIKIVNISVTGQEVYIGRSMARDWVIGKSTKDALTI